MTAQLLICTMCYSLRQLGKSELKEDFFFKTHPLLLENMKSWKGNERNFQT